MNAVNDATSVGEMDADADVFTPYEAAKRCRGKGKRVRNAVYIVTRIVEIIYLIKFR